GPAHRLHTVREEHARLVGNPAGGRPGRASTDPISLEKNDLCARHRERVSGQAPGQPSADDGHVDRSVAAVTRVIGQAGLREQVDPGRNAVLRHEATLYRAAAAESWHLISGAARPEPVEGRARCSWFAKLTTSGPENAIPIN